MNYQTVNSTDEGRDGLIFNLNFASLLLFCLQLSFWIGVYDSEFELISWQGVGLAGLAGVLLTIIFLSFTLKKGQGTQTVADFGRGLVAVKVGDNWGVFSAELQKLFLPFEFTRVSVLPRHPDEKPKYLELEKVGLIGLYSLMKWSLVIPILYKQIIKINEDLCAVQGLDDKWGVFSLKQDKLVMPVEYPGYKVWSGCHDFIGVPNVEVDRKWAIFSITDQRVVTPFMFFENIFYLGGGVFKLQKGQRKRRSENHHLRFGLYVYCRRLLIKPEYSSIEKFVPGLLELQTKGKRGLFSTVTGRIVLPVEYWSIRSLPDNELELRDGQNKKTIGLNSLKVA